MSSFGNHEYRLNSQPSHVWGAIIAGGQGTRLFPISHIDCPKQFCRLDERNTFIQAAIENLTRLGIKPTQIVVITTSDNQTKLAKEQTLSRGVLSQNICQIDPNYGYAGAMVEVARFISEFDDEAVIINTPADQFLIADENYAETIDAAIQSAFRDQFVIVGVKVNDLVTGMGCGHAIFEENGDDCYPVTGFVEKPSREEADAIMRQGNSACNTGISIWKASRLLRAVSGVSIKGINTDQLMNCLDDLRVAVGKFVWRDCGTLKSLYEISKKTPNHKNASLGDGCFERTNCLGSLLYAAEGMELQVTGARDDAIVFTVIDGRPILVIARLEDSQCIKELAEDFSTHKSILTEDFSFGARNNIVLSSNISDDLIVGFVGVRNYAVYVHKRRDGTLEAAVSQQMVPPTQHTTF